MDKNGIIMPSTQKVDNTRIRETPKTSVDECRTSTGKSHASEGSKLMALTLGRQLGKRTQYR